MRDSPAFPPEPPAGTGRFVRASDELLTAEEVADVLGMGVDWVYAQTRARKIPHIRLGRYRRYRRESIQAWLTELEDQTLPRHAKRPRTARTAGGMTPGRQS